ncbi:MAG TPA: DNA transporter [Bacteroidales bacterium]|jgi:predicted Rossmann fold nucleotide-binding protein DprA/Smf involved in DNA uptake|nr:DNA transporter [Bacteroidales bacterium]
MTNNPIPYWMAFAHAKSFSNRRKMDFLIEVVHDKETIETALLKIKSGDKLGFEFSHKEWEGIQEAVSDIPNNAFLAEKLIDQGIEIVHIMEKYAYPKVLKENLKKDAPIVIYTKGNADLLNKNSIAIVGSRSCSKKSLDFTDTIAKKAVAEKSVIVSGFAKGIDKQALDSALNHKGQSIIVLPQGIETYTTKTYYAAIVRGDVLVISIYHPKAPWSVGLAMDRNKIIYGLAKEIYAAESGNTGGTWEGVLDGIKRGRKVFVRVAAAEEKNANNLLISKGAVPVDESGMILKPQETHSTLVDVSQNSLEGSKEQEYSDKDIVEMIVKELKSRNGKGITANESIELLKLDKNKASKINKLLSSHPAFIKSKKGKENFYHLKSDTPRQTSFF